MKSSVLLCCIPLERVPQWYRTPQLQTVLLGCVFLLLFAAYTTIQFYAASTYGSDLAANSVSALYATFTASCFVAPTITNKLGSRIAMAVGILGGYVAFVVLSLVYFQGVCGPWIVIVGGILLGFGAALLWTAQGRLILQYAAVADQQQQNQSQIIPSRSKDIGNNQALSSAHQEPLQQQQTQQQKPQSGRLIGIFWAVFQGSSLVGGAISFVYYFRSDPNTTTNEKPTGSSLLYMIFLSFMIMSALLTQLLLRPSDLLVACDTQSSLPMNQDEQFVASEETSLLSLHTDSSMKAKNDKLEETITEDDEESWVEEAKDTFRLFATNRSMQILALIFFYTGFNQPYQQAVFTRFFTKRAIAVELIFFHSMEIVGAIFCGRLLDHSATTTHESGNAVDSNPRHVSMQCLVIFLVVNTVGNLTSILQELGKDEDTTSIMIVDITFPAGETFLRLSVSFLCWGFADSQLQVYCYWLMGRLFRSHTGNFSRAAAFYKCLQSLGYTLGFYLIPTERLSPLHQIIFVVSFWWGRYYPFYSFRLPFNDKDNMILGAPCHGRLVETNADCNEISWHRFYYFL